MAKKNYWTDSFLWSEEDIEDEPDAAACAAEHVQFEKSDTSQPGTSSGTTEQNKNKKSDTRAAGHTSEPGTSSGTTEQNRDNESDTTAEGHTSEPGESSRNRDHIEIQNIPVVNAETGRMYKVYEVLMNKLGVEIPELREEKLSALEKVFRKSKENVIIFFEEVNEEEENLALKRSGKEILSVAYQLCRSMTGRRIPIKGAKMVPSPISGMVMIKVKFHTLEDKKEVLAKKETLIGTGYCVDHDLTRTEIHVQSQLLKLWKKKGERKNFLLRKKTKIHVNNRWVTVRTVLAKPTSEPPK